MTPAGTGDRDIAATATTTSAELVFSFGPFNLYPRQQLLLKSENRVALGSRAFEILVALVERAGEVVEKDDLTRRVWRGLTVEESNLRAQVNALRRALAEDGAGENYVVTVPARGYRFVAPTARSTAEAALPSSSVPDRASVIPDRLTRAIGRDDIVAMIRNRFRWGRFVTIVGPPGIGKTTVGLAVVDKLAASYKDGARFVDLAPLSDPALVPTALASVLGVALRSENPYPALIASLKDKEMLLLIDNCEHVLLAAAALTEEILKGAPGVQVLATSREPLRAEDERVQRLPPLETAPSGAGLTIAEALRYPALQLFVERASASAGGYELQQEDVSVVAQICRRLDGIALAIELAASRVDAFGVRGVASRLDDRFHLLTRGRRTALPRHQTLRAALDWSYELLSENERSVMRQLGVFAGRFTMNAAIAIAADAGIDALQVDQILADLIDKSLVMSDAGSGTVYYRLTDTARAYALERLTEHHEKESVVGRHARYQLALFERSHADWETQPTAEWLSVYAPQVDDLRSAHDWAFSTGGDAELGVALTVAAVPLWFEMALMEECRKRAERALAALEQAESRDDRRRMHLYAAVAWSQMYTTASARDTGEAWRIAFDIAEALGDADYRLRALWGLWASKVNRGEFCEALAIAKRFSSVSENVADSNDHPVGDRMIGATLHFLGSQSSARQYIEKMLANYTAPVLRSHAVRFQFDQRVTARITLARVLWLQGFAEQALRCVEANIDEAISIDHRLSLCNALVQAACPVALLAGDLRAAERYTKILLDQTNDDELDIWRAYGRCFEGEMLVKRGGPVAGLRQLQAGIDELRRAKFVQYLTTFLGELANGLAASGHGLQARAVIDEAIKRSDESEERWYSPELLRIRGEVFLRSDTADAAARAQEDFLSSLRLARSQEALAWELRTATSLARLLRDRGDLGAAHELLSTAYNNFSEGHTTSDLAVAKSLLAELSAGR